MRGRDAVQAVLKLVIEGKLVCDWCCVGWGIGLDNGDWGVRVWKVAVIRRGLMGLKVKRAVQSDWQTAIVTPCCRLLSVLPEYSTRQGSPVAPPWISLSPDPAHRTSTDQASL